MAGINADDLIDIPGAEKAIDKLEKRFETLGRSIINIMNNTQASFDATIKKAVELQSSLASVGVRKGTGVGGGAAASEVERLIKEVEKYRTALKDMDDMSKLSEKSIAELKVGVSALKKQYDVLDPASDTFAEDQRKIAEQTRIASGAIATMNSTMKTALRSVNETNASYNKLARETGQLKEQLRAMPGAYNLMTGEINRNNRQAVIWQRTIEQNEKALKKMDASMGNFHRNVGNYSGALNGFANNFQQAIVGIIGVSTAFEAVAKSMKVIDQMTRLKLSLDAVSASSAQTTQRWSMISGLADSTGQDIIRLTDAYVSFTAATRGTALEGTQADKIFKSFAGSFSALGKSSEVAERGLYAVQQMISKGKVSSEELNQQLAEALPGANKLFADAMKLSTAQLADQMKKGNILATDVLPKVAEALEKLYGDRAQQNTKTISGSWTRFTNQVVKFLDLLNEKGKIAEFFSSINNGLADAFKGVNRILETRGAWDAFWATRSEGNRAKDNSRIVDEFKDLTLPDRIARVRIEQEKLAKTTAAFNKLNAGANTGLALPEFLKPQKWKDAKRAMEDQARLVKDLTKLNSSMRRSERAENAVVRKPDAPGGDDDKKKKTQFEKLIASAEKLRGVIVDDLLADFKAGRALEPSDEVLAKWNKLYAQISAVAYAAGDQVPSNLRELNDKLNKNPVNVVDQIKIETLSDDPKEKAPQMDSVIDLTKYNQLLQVHEAEMALIQSKIIDGSLSRFNDQFIPRLQDQLKKVQQLELEAAIEQNEQKKQAINEEIQLERQKYQEIMALARRDAQLRKELQQESLNLAMETAGALFQITSDQRAADMAANQAAMDHELSLVQGNKEAEERIRKEFAKKDLELRQKQARAEKAQAVFSIALNTIKAVAAANAIGPPQNIAFMAIAAAIGAVQLAAALAKPIPQFYKGTKNAPEGPAWVGERGAEIRESKGQFSLIDRPTIVPLKRGDKIYTASETRAMLAGGNQAKVADIIGRSAIAKSKRDSIYAMQASVVAINGGSQIDYNQLTNSLTKALDSRPVNQTIFDEDGVKLRQIRNNSTVTYHNKRYRL